MSMNIQEKFQKLGLGEKIILVAGPLLFIDSFLPWYDLDLGDLGDFAEALGVSSTLSGWQGSNAIWSIFAVFIGLAMAGAVAAGCVLIRLLAHSGDVGFGFLIGIILVIALAVGGFLTCQEEQKSNDSTGTDAGAPGGGGADAGPSM